MSRSSAFSRRWSKDHQGFNPLKQPGMLYTVERLVANVWIPVGPHKTIESALRYIKGKPEWQARVVRMKDGAVVT